MSDSLAIKGVRDSLLITLPSEAGANAIRDLLHTIEQRSDFFRGARLALDVGGLALGAAELGKLREELSRRNVTLFALLAEHDATRSAAADLGLEHSLDRAASDDARRPPAIDTAVAGEFADFITRTLRSGNRIDSPSHVVILGDVNPGAEVVAAGNIVVWGKVRGVVHAGADGDETAAVCALDLAPTQLRIGGLVALSPEQESQPRPEVAFVREGQIVAEPWDRLREELNA